MPRIECFATSEDAVVLRVDLRCCACTHETLRLASIDRPPGRLSARHVFKRRHLWTRIPFQCRRCAYLTAILVDITDAKANDFDLLSRQDREWPEAQPDTYPSLPRTTTLMRRFEVRPES